MQFESHPFNEIAEVVLTPYSLRVSRSRAANGDGPSVSVVRGRECLTLLMGEHYRSVAIDYWPVYRDPLQHDMGSADGRYAGAGTYALADAVVGGHGGREWLRGESSRTPD